MNLSPATVAALATGALRLYCPPDLARRVVWELPEAGGWPHDPASVRAIRGGLPPGSRVALDDVGAGSADLTGLAALRPDYAKLARALVAGLDGDPARQAVVRAVAGAASEMGTAVVAEGVEREEEARCLRALGRDLRPGLPVWRAGAPGGGLRCSPRFPLARRPGGCSSRR